MRCLEPTEIERYVLKEMNRRVAEEVTRHLSSCERCRTLVAERRNQGGAEEPAATPQKAMVKVQCGTCNARYGIPEERLKGKVLKIRCKECKTIIEVRPPAATRGVLERGTKQWFVVVKRQRTGPFTEQEIRDKFTQGELKAKSYCWRRGFTQWERLQNIPAFEDLLAAPAAEADPLQDGPRTLPLPGLITTEQQRSDQTEVGRPDGMMEYAGEGHGSELDLPTDPDANREPYGVHLTGSFADKPDAGDTAFQQQLDEDQGAPFQEDERTDSDDVETSAPQQEASSADEAFASEAELALASTMVHEVAPQTEEAEAPAPTAGDGADQSTGEGDADGGAADDAESETFSDDDMSSGGEGLSEGEFDKHMKGQRHENSVLFSLGHLQNIAMAGKPKPVSPEKSSGNKPTGLTGLFDVRSVASPASPIMLPADPPESKGMKMSTLVGMMVLGIILGVGLLGGGVYLLKPEIIEALMGQEPSTRVARKNKPAVKGEGITAPAAKKPHTAPLAQVPEGADAVAKKGAEKPDAGIAAPDAAAAVAVAPAAAAAPEKKDEAPPPAVIAKASTPRKKRVRRVKPRGKDKAAPVAKDPGVSPKSGDKGDEAENPARTPESPAPAEKKAPEGAGGKGDAEGKELDKLIDAATTKKLAPSAAEGEDDGDGKPEKKPEPQAGAVAEPKSLDQHQIAVGMRKAQAAVNACGERFKRDGEVKIKVTIDGASQRITKGSIVGQFAGTPLGTCVLSAVKTSARFPKFSDQPLTLQYPFFIRIKSEDD